MSLAANLSSIELRDASKRYADGKLACDGVSLSASRGEIHAIVGENGAGKSTALKMLYGLEQPTRGTILMDGMPRRFRSPADAIDAGIGLVPQHLELVPSFSVADNVVLGVEPRRGVIVDRRRAATTVAATAARFGLHVDPTAVVASLSIGEQQRVALLKTLHRGARVILLDEPTAVLAPHEARHLFDALRRFAAEGLAVVVITHKLAEVMEMSDRFTVLRAGRVAGTGATRDASAGEIAGMIVGGAQPPARPSGQIRRPTASEPLVKARDLALSMAGRPQALHEVCFDIAAGEILGVAGVEGNGQNALADLMCGLVAPSRGLVTLDERVTTGHGVRAARAAGVGAISENRLHDGVAPRMSVRDNVVAASYHLVPLSRHGWMIEDEILRVSNRLLAEFGVVARSPESPIGSLSGGNMQKVVLARELGTHPRLLVASQPSLGLDIGATAAMHRQLRALRDRGAAVLLVSADLDELLALSDRVVVMFRGAIVAHFAADAVSAATLGPYMTGLRGTPGTQACARSAFTQAHEEARA